jgi:hypothetical protein
VNREILYSSTVLVLSVAEIVMVIERSILKSETHKRFCSKDAVHLISYFMKMIYFCTLILLESGR